MAYTTYMGKAITIRKLPGPVKVPWMFVVRWQPAGKTMIAISGRDAHWDGALRKAFAELNGIRGSHDRNLP